MENMSEMHENAESQNERGGKRQGAGRPKTGRLKIYVNHTISGSKEEIEMIKKKAAEQNKTVSRYVIELVQKS